MAWWLELLAHAAGFVMKVTNADLGSGSQFDLTQPENVERITEEIKDLKHDGCHGGPPCATWSGVRWKSVDLDGLKKTSGEAKITSFAQIKPHLIDSYPPPVRSSDAPWGLSDLPPRMDAKLREANLLMQAMLQIVMAFANVGCCSMEHPESRKKWPYSSIFDTEIFKKMAKLGKLVGSWFPQCMYGSPAFKETEIWSTHEEILSLNRECTHRSHEKLVGLDSSGSFKTKAAQAYPEELNKALAEFHMKIMIARGPVYQKEEEEDKDKPAIGEKLPVPPLAASWLPIGRWKECFRTRWKKEEHINVLEVRTVLLALQRKAGILSSWGKKHLIFVDSQVTLAAVSKGRSSASQINFLIRKMAGIALAFGFRIYMRRVPTKLNHADGPSRMLPLGPAEGTMEHVMPVNFKKLPG